MYHHIRGTLHSKQPGEAVVEAGGVGYLIRIALGTYESLPVEGKPVCLLTHLHVTDDALTLFGFAQETERRFFLQLVNTVTGVGPKLALAVLSGGRLEHIQQAIRLGDVKALKAIKGLGDATAKRIVLELGKILVKEAGGAEGGVRRAAGAKGGLEGVAASPLPALDELTELAVRAVVQLNEVPRDVALRAVQRVLEEFSAAGRAPQAIQDVITRALAFTE